MTLLFAVGMSRAHVTQSDGWLPIADAPKSATLSESLPGSATQFCFASSSVGLSGRLMAYAVDGTPGELDAFALAEFAAHWKRPEYSVELNASSPFDSEYIAFLERAYSVDLEWLRQSSNGNGSIYHDSKDQGSRMPTIFVDKANCVLYFVMTD